jgi:Putative adhesin
VIVLRLTLTVLGALLLIFLIACGAYGLSDVAARHSYHVHDDYAGVHAIHVDGGGGDVHLTAAPAGSAVAVDEHVTEGLTSPHSEAVRMSGGVLHLSADCSFVFANSCGASYTIAVPSGIVVDAHSADGNIDADGISAGDVTLQSGNGDVTASLNQAPARLKATSGNGDVTLTVPNTTYAVHASSGNGSVSDGTLRIDPSARRTITATSGNGDVTIKTSGAGNH